MSTLLDVPLTAISVVEGRNPRKVDITDEEGQRTKASIAKRGILQPLVVHPNGGKGKYNLIAGERRLRIAQELKLKTVPVIVRANGDDALSVAAEENLHRRELSPLEEAIAFQRLVDAGLTPDGVAEELNVALKRVTERLPILKLPEDLQECVGRGEFPLSSVGWLAAIVDESPKIGAIVCKAIMNGGVGYHAQTPWEAGQRLGLQFAAQAAEKYGKGKMPTLDTRGMELPEQLLKLLPKDTQAQAAALDEKEYGYTRKYRLVLDTLHLDALKQPGSGAVVFSADDGEVRGVVFEDLAWLKENAPPIIKAEFDRREKAKTKDKADDAKALARATKALGDKATPEQIAAAQAAVERENAAKAKRREELDAERAHVRACREANTDLGHKLLNGLASVTLTKDVALFLCHMSLLPGGGYVENDSNSVPRLAAHGLAVVLPDWQTETEQKNGTVKVAYPGMDDAAKRFWKWWGLAKTPEEIVGRTIIAHAAAAYALQTAVPKGQQVHFSPRRGKDGAAFKALEAIVKRHLPASWKKVDAADKKTRA